MPEKVWTGSIFLKHEGGYEITIKSLNHYKKRLRTIGNSPELKDSAAMFASVLQQEAMKTIPKIDVAIKKIQDSLLDTNMLNSLHEDIPFLIKALSCYESDIKKAQDTGHEYFLKLIGDLPIVKNNLKKITLAIHKIKEFSDDYDP